MKRFFTGTVYPAMVCLISLNCFAAIKYDVELIQQGTQAWAVNDSGQVIIYPFDAHTYIWYNGQVSDVGRIGNNPVYAQNLNNSGLVVGRYIDGENDRAFSGVNGTIQDFGVNPGGSSTAMCVNNHGTIAGVMTVNGTQQAFITQDGITKAITGNDGQAWAYDINDSGKVVGDGHIIFDGQNRNWPYIYHNGKTTYLPVSQWGIAQGINNNDQIVGSIGVGSNSHAFIYENGSFADIGSIIPGDPRSSAVAINDAGQVAIQAFLADGMRAAYLYEDGQVHNLTDLLADPTGITIMSVEDINSNGQMVGLLTKDYCYYSYIMTPVPEPATISILALGGLAILRRRRFLE